MDEQSEFDDKTSLTSHGSNTTDIDKVRLWLYFVSLARASAGAINQILIRSRIIYIDSAGEEEMHKDVSFIHLFLSSSFFKERILDLSFFLILYTQVIYFRGNGLKDSYSFLTSLIC